MIKAVILDDEERGGALLNHKLATFADKIEVVAIFNEPEKALLALKTLEIHVLFLDIDMPKINGFQFLERLGHFDFEVIFVTAYTAFVLDALRKDALDYLMKPVNSEELENALTKLETRLSRSMKLQSIPKKESSRLALATAEGIYYVKKSDIVCIEAMSNYSVFYLITGKKIIVSKTLKEYEGLLCDTCFFRVNRGAIVNLDFVEKYRKGDGGVLELINGAEIEVSSSKKASLMTHLNFNTI